MSRYLIKVTEQYRCDSEEEARKLIEEAKKNNQYTVTKSSSEIKTLKQKGEIVDEWRRVLITKEFCDEKEPYCQLEPEYVEADYE
ncbi:MAG: hypothetical protein IKN65_06560 [Clostridia bacterium]|jgi:hypothetical protein|nr:hypothetical protein [Clostridia bacterium]